MKKMILVLTIALLVGCSTPTRLIVKSEPSGAKVYIDGTLIGDTSVEHKLEKKRSYLVKVEKKKYLAMTKTVSKNDREVITLNFDLEPKHHAELVIIRSKPAGAYVTLDDEDLCTTPCDIELDDKDPSTRRILKIHKRGFEPHLLQVKYKGDDWNEDNFADNYMFVLEPVLTQ
jgi:hypothetical protein